jgi:CBS domain-containing protein
MMPDLASQTKVQRLRIYISESDRWRGKPLEMALLDTLRAQGVAGATVFRGIGGFGAHSSVATTSIEVLSMDLPIVVEVIDTPEKITSILDVVSPMVREGLITLEDVQLVKYTHRFRNPLPADRLVGEIANRKVVFITTETTIYEAWKRMLDEHVKDLPVVNSSGQAVGILTDEDLLERGGIRERLSVAVRLDEAEINQELAQLKKSAQTVESVMTQPVVTVFESESLGTATLRMVKKGLKRLPVVDENGILVGMLSRLDVLRQVAQVQQKVRPDAPHPPRGRTVQEIMTTQIPMVNQDDNLASVIEQFAQNDTHRLVVVDGTGRAIGLLSDSDVVARMQPARRKNILDAFRQIGKPAPGTETASDLMSPGPLTAPPDLPVVDAIQKMLAESRKWLVVIDESGKPLGLVDRQILLEAVIGEEGENLTARKRGTRRKTKKDASPDTDLENRG